MEEQQIQDFVHRAVTDRVFRQELAVDPWGVLVREGYEAYPVRVLKILARLVPCLAFEQPLSLNSGWWGM
ncbi:MAG TPA: hypothetical protein VGD98_25720 [Ktedonobacteraceae bacterium]